MKLSTLSALTCLLLISCLAPLSRAQSPLGPGFTYQGQLTQGGTPMNGAVSLRFSLWDAAGSGSPPTGGHQLGSTQQITGVPITDGQFTVTLNASNQFTSAPFNGQARFLQVEVCSDANCITRTTLSPRQPLTIVPNAAFASAPWIQPTAGGTALAYTAGNVGIGTTSPSNRLHVVAASVGDGIRLTGGPGADAGFQFYNGTTPGGGLGLAASAGNWSLDAGAGDLVLRANSGNNLLLQSGSGGAGLAIDFANNIGIGTTAIGAKLDVRGDAKVQNLTVNGTQNNSLMINSPQTDFPISPFDLMLSLHSTTSQGGAGIHFSAAARTKHGILNWRDRFSLNNSQTAGAALLNDDGSWSTTSDRRSKTDIAPAQGLLAKALALKPAEFYMNNQDRTLDPHKYLGLIAQEVQPIFPSLVHTNSTDGMLSMNYDRIAVVAIGAIQEQQRIIAEQQRQIDTLTARLERLESLQGPGAPNAAKE